MAFTSTFTEEIDSSRKTEQLIQRYDLPDGILDTPSGEVSLQPRRGTPVENSLAPRATVAPRATNKDDDDLKSNHHQRGRQHLAAVKDNGNHRGASAPRERKTPGGSDFGLVRAAYEKATGNLWNKSDTEAYEQNRLEGIPAGKIISVLEAVVRRTPTKINSFKYFVKEVLAVPDGRNRGWQKKQLEKIVRRIRDSAVGRSGYSGIDFLEDVKCACAREGIVFDDDIYNELVE